MSDDNSEPLRRKIRLQRAAMLWEKVWAAAQAPLFILLLALAVLLSGALTLLPRPVPLAVLVIGAGAFLFSLKSLFRLAVPTPTAVLRRLDTSNALAHREASSLDDSLVASSGQAELWDEHLRRKLAALTTLRLAWPKSAWRSFDPLALRLPIILVALAAGLLGTGGFSANFRNAASLGAPVAEKPTAFDAWARPPIYTGKPPLLLTSPAMADKLKVQADILVPENSTFTLRLNNAADPHLAFFSPGNADAPIKLDFAKTTKSDEGFSADVKLDRPVTIKVMDGSKEVASYPFTVITDEAPKVDFVEDPKLKGLGQLAVKWHGSDDYGIKSVTAEISLSDTQDDGQGFESNGVFLYDPPQFKIALNKPNAKDIEETSNADLSGHPWAGLQVEMTLTAIDAAGHKTVTPPKRFKLPERDFTKPLAQAVAEQRKKVILSPDAAPDASTMLGAMLLYPVDIRDNTGLILNLASIKSRLAQASAPDDVVAVVKDLWPIILAIEEGHLNDIKAELKNLAEELKQALRDGASQDKIDDLMQRMRKAMKKLAEQMQKEGKKRQADGTMPKQGRAITPEQLQKMLDDIKKLSQKGDKEAAEQMLSELDQMLQNLQPGQGQQANNGEPGAQEQMDALSGMMGKQRRLMDETQRMGQNGKDGESEGLAGKQGGLKDELGKLGQGMAPDDGSDSLGEAGKSMGQAQDSLRQGNKEEALRQQNEAMKRLREGLGKMAEKLGREGQQGEGGQSGNAEDDPLGRPRATHSPGTGPDKNLVPSELAMRRAREILEELRAKANAQGLDDETKAYIDRLLKGLY